MRLISFDSFLWNSEVTLFNSILRTISYKLASNALKCSFFGGVLTDLNSKLSTVFSGVLSIFH